MGSLCVDSETYKARAACVLTPGVLGSQHTVLQQALKGMNKREKGMVLIQMAWDISATARRGTTPGRHPFSLQCLWLP